MQPDIKIETSSVRAHSRMVDETARMIDEGTQAGQWVRADGQAYGLLYGHLFTSILNPQQDHAISALKLASDGTSSLAELLRAAADDLDRGDDDAAARFGGK
jgi:hypothetical protein